MIEEAAVQHASFTAPATPVNAFNRTQNLGDVYVSVFRPSASQRWRGNVKKYRLGTDGSLLGRNGQPAVDPATGRFLPGVGSLWPVQPKLVDGDDVLAGGAARSLPLPAERRIYTNLDGANAQPLANYEIGQLVNHAQAATVLGYVAAGVAPPVCPADAAEIADPHAPAVCQLVSWLRGADVADRLPAPAGNGNVTELRYDLGDPLHAKPAVVIHGGDAAAPAAVVYALTNDGLLHALDADTGRERWAFVPWDRLARTLSLYRDAGAQPRSRWASTARCACSRSITTATAWSSRPPATGWCCTSACAAAGAATTPSTSPPWTRTAIPPATHRSCCGSPAPPTTSRSRPTGACRWSARRGRGRW